MQTRDGTTELLPNEKFMRQKIVKLSYNDRRGRLHLGLGISYDADVKKAIFVATEAALTVDPVLQDPQPLCHVTGFSDSSVDMDLRLWIKDPENGMANLKGGVYLASTVYIVFFLLLEQCHQ
jgi:small-conductance mechanosensitive channel